MFVGLLALVGFSTAGFALQAAEPAKLYGTRLNVPKVMRPELQGAVADLQHALQRMTGKEFLIEPATGELAKGEPVTGERAKGERAGIVLRKVDDASVPAEIAKRLPDESREGYVIWPDGDARLWLVSRSDLGLNHAVYGYLEQLGARWYFPSERWTIFPKREDLRLTEPMVSQPAFRSRMFAGSGGFGGNLPLDPKRDLQKRWTDWQRRNRFGGEFRVSGHSGEGFNLKHRKELEAHPEWRAMVDGKRVPWSITAKFCAGNREVVDLYVKDRLDDYRARRKRDPEDPGAWAVSVEPADGGGHCTDPASLEIGSVSDRVFYVANEVAKEVRKEFPQGHVSLFAYNEHAAVPSIAIEPNVYVQVIPYAFQRTGLSPDQLLDAWSRKVPRMGVYDYWSIPDWSHDLPSFDPLVFGPARLRGWHRRGVDSFLCESTFSSGAMGPAWYIASRLAWRPDQDVDALFDRFLQDCFGGAAEPMRRMLARWSERFTLTSHELALSLRDLQEARKLAAGDAEAAARVADYGRYVIYLRLYFEHQLAKRGSEERRAAAERLMRHLWSIYDSSMVHAFRLSQLLARDERLAGNVELGKAFDWQDAKATGWPTIRPMSDAEVWEAIDRGASELQPQQFTSRKFTGALVPLTNGKAPATSAQPAVLALSNSLEFDVRAERDDFRCRVQIATEKPVQVLVSGPDGGSVGAQTVVTGETWRTDWTPTELVLPKQGTYRVQIVSQKRPFRFAAPADVHLSMPGWTNSQGAPTPRLYFYVPAGVDRIAIYANYTSAGPPRFFDPAGKEVRPELVDQGHLLLIPTTAEQRGKVWSLDRAKCPVGPLAMLNVPASFAFSPEALLVPSDALAETDGRQ